jgi:rhomboid protease GluP
MELSPKVKLLIYGIVGVNILMWIGANVVDFGLYPDVKSMTTGKFSDIDILFNSWTYIFSMSREGIKQGEYYRFLTSTFLHKDVIHIFMNMLSFVSLAPLVSRLFGPRIILPLYILTGVVGSVFSYLAGTTYSLGASGAVFGFVGALLAFAVIFKNREFVRELLSVIAINFAFGLINAGSIDNWAHLGGLLSGVVIGGLLSKMRYDNMHSMYAKHPSINTDRYQ